MFRKPAAVSDVPDHLRSSITPSQLLKVATTNKETLYVLLVAHKSHGLILPDMPARDAIFTASMQRSYAHAFYLEYRDDIKFKLGDDVLGVIQEGFEKWQDQIKSAEEQLNATKEMDMTKRSKWRSILGGKRKKVYWLTSLSNSVALWKLSIEMTEHLLGCSEKTRDHTRQEVLKRLQEEVVVVNPTDIDAEESMFPNGVEPGDTGRVFFADDSSVDQTDPYDQEREKDRDRTLYRCMQRVDQGKSLADKRDSSDSSLSPAETESEDEDRLAGYVERSDLPDSAEPSPVDSTFPVHSRG